MVFIASENDQISLHDSDEGIGGGNDDTVTLPSPARRWAVPLAVPWGGQGSIAGTGDGRVVDAAAAGGAPAQGNRGVEEG